jgi:hypothetical protein
MKDHSVALAVKAAELADKAYSEAIAAAGFKSRWELPSDVMRTHNAIREAYCAKVMFDNAMHEAFELSRAKA